MIPSWSNSPHEKTKAKIFSWPKNLESGSGKMNYSEVKSTYCSCRGPNFNTQNLHVSSEPSASPGSEDLMLLWAFAHMWYTYIHSGTHICTNSLKKKNLGPVVTLNWFPYIWQTTYHLSSWTYIIRTKDIYIIE